MSNLAHRQILGFASTSVGGLGSGQYHLAVAGGYVAVWRPDRAKGYAPTRYREVVLTRSNGRIV